MFNENFQIELEEPNQVNISHLSIKSHSFSFNFITQVNIHFTDTLVK